MDALELPLPVNVLVGKLMASDGLDRVEEVDSRNSVLPKGSRCAPSRAEYVSSSRNKKVDNGSFMRENTTSCLQYGDHNKGNYVEVENGDIKLPPNHKGKLIQRKSANNHVNTSSKRPRNEEIESCKENAGNLGREAITNEVEHDPLRCIFDEKALIAKQRRVHDGKRMDKRNFRSTIKNKYEYLVSKTGLLCNDTFASGNTFADLHDFAKNLGVLSLSELLDGSYDYVKLPLEKGKKSSVVNDSILLSVRKAYSILFPPALSAAEKTNSMKESQSSQKPGFFMGSGSDCETKENHVEESLSKFKAHNLFHENILESTVLHPKKIVSQLTLPAAHELEGFLLNSGVCSAPVQIMEKAEIYTRTNIPPYHWSFSHAGNSKPTFEMCKLSSAKSTSQGKWIRIWSGYTRSENDRSFLSGLFLKYERDEDSIKQQKINDVLQDIKSFTSTFQPPSVGSFTESLRTYPDIEIPAFMESVNRCGMPYSFNSRMFQNHGDHTSNSHWLEAEFNYHTSHESTASEAVLRCKGNEISLHPPKFNLLLKDKADMKVSPTGSIFCCSMSSCFCEGTNTEPGCSSRRWSAWEKYRQDFSFEEFSAAIILSGLGVYSDPIRVGKTSNGRIRWPRAHSMKTTSACMFSCSVDARRYDLVERANMRFTAERRADPLRQAPWQPSGPLGAGASPRRLEKDPGQTRVSLSPLSTQLCSRAKACDDPTRKTPAKPPSAAFRDWIRSKSKLL